MYGGRDGWRVGGMEGGREGWMEGGRAGGREGGRAWSVGRWSSTLPIASTGDVLYNYLLKDPGFLFILLC